MTVKGAYTAKELSQLLDIAHKNLLARADRENWQPIRRAKKLGGNEWLLESMPEATRHTIATAIASRIAQQSPAPALISPDVFTVNTLANVPEQKRKHATARAVLVSMAREFGAASGTARSVAYEVFCHEYNRGAIDAPAWVRELLPRTSRATLANWEKALEANGLAALTNKHGQHRKGKGLIDATPGMADVVVAHIIKYYDETAEEVMEALEVTHAGHPILRRRGYLYRSLTPGTTANSAFVGTNWPYAAAHQFGARIKRAGGTATLYFRQDKRGRVSNRFVKRRLSNFTRQAHVGPYEIVIPARAFLFTEAGRVPAPWQERCRNIVLRHLEASR